MSEKQPIIRVKNVIKEFGKGDGKFRALNDVSLDVYAGEYVMLFGPSGCGKSTLLNCLAGLEKPTSGQVILRGEDLSKMTPIELAEVRNRKIGMIFQQFNIIKSFNVVKNVALPQLINGVPRKRRMRRAMELIDMFGLRKLAYRIPTEISGGQQQRIAIARALINNPWIFIVDEPTGSLDSKAAQEVMDLLEQLNKKSKRTLILVTHNAEYLKYADTVYHLKDGRITKVERRSRVADFDEKEHEQIKVDLK
jgi:putative ABC transport system ATP-binding protein